MKNPYMKFQNPSMHGSEVTLCIKKRNGWTDAHTHKRPRSNMPLQRLRSWGHNNSLPCLSSFASLDCLPGLSETVQVCLDRLPGLSEVVQV